MRLTFIQILDFSLKCYDLTFLTLVVLLTKKITFKWYSIQC